MEEYSVKEISNGWVLSGWTDKKTEGTINRITEKEIFLPTISAVADILETWQIQGFIKAASRAAEKYKR